MYEFFNPNPFNKSVGDCVIRAICKAMDKSWNEVFIELFTFAYNLKDMPSSNFVWGKYLQSKGYKKYLIPDICPDCYTINDFAVNSPHGTFIVGTGTHVTCIIDGIIYDSWNCGSETPIYYFVKE